MQRGLKRRRGLAALKHWRGAFTLLVGHCMTFNTCILGRTVYSSVSLARQPRGTLVVDRKQQKSIVTPRFFKFSKNQLQFLKNYLLHKKL